MKSFPCRAMLFSILVLLAAPLARGDALDGWQWRNPYPTGNQIAGIVFGGGQFVAVDSAGYVLTTEDGVTWLNRGPSTVKTPRALIHAGGKYVIVGDGGQIATSEDAITWTARASGTTQALVGVTYGNGAFVAVGGGATLLSSTDGTTWTSRTTGLDPFFSFRGVAFGSGRFVAINNVSAVADLYTSEDGVAWEKTTVSGIGQHVVIVTDGNRFILDAWYEFGAGVAYPVPWTSTNGLNWVRTGSSRSAGNGGKVIAGGTFFTFGFYDNGTNYGIATSPDGMSWTPQTLPSSALFIKDLAYGNGIYLGVGGFAPGGSGAVVKSSNTVNWVVTSRGDHSFYSADATYGAGKYVFVGSTIVVSTNGQTFQRVDFAPSGLTAVSFAGGKFVAVGADGTIIRSTNGMDWNRSTSGTLNGLSAIAYGAGRWVAVGAGGAIRVSNDGLLWEGRWSGTDLPLNGLIYAQGMFVAVGRNGLILTSSDGLTWSPQFNDDSGTLTDIAFGNGNFVAVGESLMSSPDGVTWTRQSGPLAVNRIAFGDGTFAATRTDTAAVGDGRGLMTSADGLHWEARNTPVSFGVGVAFLENTFLLFGGNGSILQSTPAGAIVLGAAKKANGAFEITISGAPIGATSKLQSCTNFSSKIWSDVSTVVHTQTVTIVPVPGGLGASQRFYRTVTGP